MESVACLSKEHIFQWGGIWDVRTLGIPRHIQVTHPQKRGQRKEDYEMEASGAEGPGLRRTGGRGRGGRLRGGVRSPESQDPGENGASPVVEWLVMPQEVRGPGRS